MTPANTFIYHMTFNPSSTKVACQMGSRSLMATEAMVQRVKRLKYRVDEGAELDFDSRVPRGVVSYRESAGHDRCEWDFEVGMQTQHLPE